jgi:hypothetical protein
MFLLDEHQLNNLREGREFLYYWGKTKILESGLQEFNDVKIIRAKVIIVAVNVYSSSPISVNFKYGWVKLN